MATRNAVPRADGEGSLGTILKRWLSGFFYWLNIKSYIKFATDQDNPTHEEGRIFWDKTQKTLSIYNENSEVTHNLGQEHLMRVHNDTGSDLENGKVVRILGSNGAGHPCVVLAKADIEATAHSIGITTSSILTDGYGYVAICGKVHEVDTSSFSEGDVLYLSDTVAGGITTTKPSIVTLVGFVLVSHATQGIIYAITQEYGAVDADMLKTVYDTNDNGVVDKAEKLSDGVNEATAADTKDAVDKKHSHVNKATLDLIEEALTSALKTAYDDAVTKVHEHPNKATLDLVEEALTSALKTAYDDAVTKAHTHANKATLDAIEETFTTALKNKLDGIESGAVALATVKADTDISDAISKKHSHANKTTLDAIQEAFTTVLKDKLDGIEAGSVSLATVKADSDISDAITKKHAQNTDTQLDNGVLEIDGSDNLILTQNSVAVLTSINASAVVNTLYLKEGRVGIGITDPSAKIHIIHDTRYNYENEYAIKIESVAGGDIGLLIGTDDDYDIGSIQAYDPLTSWTSRALIFQPQGGKVGIGFTGTPAMELDILAADDGGIKIHKPTSTSVGDEIGIDFGFKRDVAAEWNTGARVVAVAEDTTFPKTGLAFHTGDWLYGVTEKVRIDYDGNLNILNGNLTLPKTSGIGIKIDTTTPTFGWRDLQGNITNAGGANKPTNATYRGGITQFQFAAGDESILEYHIPHDYVPGTDIYFHVHWSHTSDIVTGGTITFTAESSYAKGHNQAPFSAPVTGTLVGTASTTQYQQIISEIQYSASSPTGLQIDTDDLEPDGIILLRLEMTTNNITSGGAVPDPFIHHVDIHYQTNGVLGTKQKAPDFYV